MKVKIICNENFQTVETVIDVDDYGQITDTILNLRTAIYNATSDVENKKSKPKQKEFNQNQHKQNNVIPPSNAQIKYLTDLGLSEEELSKVKSSTEASRLITKLKSTKIEKANTIDDIDYNEIFN